MEPISKNQHLDSTFPSLLQRSSFLSPYLYSLCIIVLITGIGLLIRNMITPTNLVMPYLLGVVSIAVFWGRGPAIFASVLGVFAFDIFLVPPYLTLVVEDTEYVITFLTLFLVGILISNLTARIKEQMIEAKERESRVTSLYHLSQALAVAHSLPDALNAIVNNMRNTLGRDVWIYLSNRSDQGSRIIGFDVFPSDGDGVTQVNDAVLFAFRSGTPSGFGTDSFSKADTINFPLLTNSGTLGVISISTTGLDRNLDNDQLQVYEAFANLSALAIERIFLDETASQSQLLKAKEELQSALLNSVSHDFRTPLVTITGTLSSLDSEIHLLDKNSQQGLVRQALDEAEKLNRLVSNLLNMSRLESGALQLQLEPVDLQDLIGTTLEHMKSRIDRQITIEVPPSIPLISADFVLMQQVLMNLIENAIKYSPDESPVDIRVHIHREWVYLEVADHGPGIDKNEIPNIFEKFYRVKKQTQKGGTGLGLAIVKGIIDAHEAKIKVFPRDGGGMVFQIGFPQLAFQAIE